MINYGKEVGEGKERGGRGGTNRKRREGAVLKIKIIFSIKWKCIFAVYFSQTCSSSSDDDASVQSYVIDKTVEKQQQKQINNNTTEI